MCRQRRTPSTPRRRGPRPRCRSAATPPAHPALPSSSSYLRCSLLPHSQATVGALKSTVLTLALLHGRVGVAAACEAARVEEEWQIGEHGFVEDGHDKARAQLGAQISAIALYVALLPPQLRLPPAPPAANPERCAAAAAERSARVLARRAREEALVARKRAEVRERLMAQLAAERSGEGAEGAVVEATFADVAARPPA